MTKLYIMCGLAFSGKSTLSKKIAERTSCKRIAFDELWIEAEKHQDVPQGVDGWKLVRALAQDKILTELKAGNSVVYDENNPKKEHRNELREVAKRAGAQSIVIYTDVPLNIIKAREEANRILQNRHDVDPINFEKVLSDLEPPSSDENVIVFKSKDNLEDFVYKLE